MKRKWMRTSRLMACSVVLSTVATFAGATFAAAGAADQPNPYRARVAEVFDQMQQGAVNLSAEQKGRISTILREAIPRAVDIHDNMSLTPERKWSQLQALFTTTQERMKAVLTPEQQKQSDAKQAADAKRRGEIFQEVAAELQLSEDQQKRIRPIVERAVAQAAGVGFDAKLTLAQKLIRLSGIHGEASGQINGVLTPEQRRKLEQMMAAVGAEMLARHQAMQGASATR